MGILLLAGAATALAVHLGWVKVPPNFAPWSDVELEHEPGWFAKLQINGLARDVAACRAALDRSELRYEALPDRPERNGCGLSGGVSIVRSHIPYSSGFQATCALAAGLYWYENLADLAARRHLGSGLARIDHLGSYACRNIGGGDSGRRSQHATANALDIAAFRLQDGQIVSVRRDWGKDTAKGRFLQEAHDGACRFFNTVLGPDYNAAHADHFHLDLGPARLCR
ncbi:extensin family protein [Emcibacter sp. SYSU 3D8]|uniref:extensin-like domain-containing protein n=1 Tax=Emcibacter sp. SYSU 3D8 TaxID=3133969 RepID=UPI0031FE4785